MFNLDADDSFYSYLDMIAPDIAFIQECRYNRINQKWLKGKYTIQCPEGLKEPINSRWHLTLALRKTEPLSEKCPEPEECSNPQKYDYRNVFLKYCEGTQFAGVHLPLPDFDDEQGKKEYSDLLSKLKSSNSAILCGDFNASSNNENQKFIESLCKSEEYIDLWREGLNQNQNKAYYIDFSGEIKQANIEKHLAIRTFIRNRHLDYVLAKKNFPIKLEKITIDYRTLAFTDHCGIIVDFNV